MKKIFMEVVKLSESRYEKYKVIYMVKGNIRSECFYHKYGADNFMKHYLKMKRTDIFTAFQYSSIKGT